MYRQSLTPNPIHTQTPKSSLNIPSKTMKTRFTALSRSWRCLAAAGLALFAAQEVRALDIIGPTGSIYTNIISSSQFSTGFVASNLFSTDMTGATVGQTIGGAEWAKSGSGNAYVAFQVDQSYSVGSVFWAQRNGSTTGDNMQLMSIWVSDTTNFAAADPGTPPVDVVPLQANVGASVWREYPLTNLISGKYYLLYLQQTAGNVGGNPGGNEMRLGLNPTAVAPSVTQTPDSKTVYTGGSVSFESAASGTLPLTYRWYRDNVPLQDDARISGATTTRLTVTQLSAGDVGNYSLTVTNAFGGAQSAAATLTLAAVPNAGYKAAVMSNSPVGYWQLDEPTGPTAFDYAGGHNGVYWDAAAIGVPGPQSPEEVGFTSTNTAVGTSAFQTNTAVALPPLNLGTNNTVTITAWVKPSGAQQAYAGLVFSRSAGTISGLSYDSTGKKLAYEGAGNRVTFDSGVTLADGVWHFLALVVTPTNATLYSGTNHSVRVAVDTLTQPVQTFAGTTMIGLDVSAGEASRTFNGTIDEVAIFNRSLSTSDINALYAAGIGNVLPLPVDITLQPTNQALFYGERLTLVSAVSGAAPITNQWYKDGVAIPGATSTTYVNAGVRPTDAGNYYLVAANVAGAATSSVAQVTVDPTMLRILDPKGSGTVYGNIVASSVFGNNIPTWGPSNLFKTDVTLLAVGATMTTEGSGKEWATAGTNDAWISFQVDQSYPVPAIYWSQRVGSGTGDNMQSLSIWASDTTAFTTNDPGRAPDASISLTPNSGNPVWLRYMLPAPITGRYFLLHLQKTPNSGNPGGSEFRLAVTSPPPLSVTKSANLPILTWPVYGDLLQASDLAGPWTPATGITNGVPFTPTGSQQYFRVQFQQ